MLPAYNLKLVMSEANLCRQHREPDVGSFWIILEANLPVELTPMAPSEGDTMKDPLLRLWKG